jgi:hypothetical protein
MALGLSLREYGAMTPQLITAISLAAIACACATSSQQIIGAARAPIAPDEVRVYTQSPPHFEEIAVLSASRRTVTGGEQAIEKMIESLKAQAAMLGANGLLLDDFSDEQALSVGTGVGTDTYTHNGSVSLGAAGSVGVVKKTVKCRAIFVPPS